MKSKALIVIIISFLVMVIFTLMAKPLYAISSAPSRINVTFYNQSVDSRGFNWVTNQSVDDGYLQIIKKTNSIDKNQINWADATEVNASSNDFFEGYRAWKAFILDLEYGSLYYYRVGSKVLNSWSVVGEQYITDGSEGVRFSHLTDPQSYTAEEYLKWTNTINIITENFPRTTAMFLAGDLTQQNSQAAQNIHEWGYALDGPSHYFMNNVVSPAVGNHDKAEGMFYNHFNIGLPNNQDTSKGVYYTYTIQDVQVIVLNTNDELTFSQPLAQKQVSWLEDVLEQSTALWKVVVFHHAVISTGRHMLEPDISSLRTMLMPLFSKYEVDLVVQGHDHVYSRSEPYRWHDTGFVASTDKPVVEKQINNKTFNYYTGGSTFYVVQNMATARTAALSRTADEDTYPSFMRIATSPINSKFLSQQPNVPTFGYITIKDGQLLYETYILENFKDLVLYDYFGISKNSIAIVEKKIEALPNAFDSKKLDEIAEAINAFNELPQIEQVQIDISLRNKLNVLSRNMNITDYNQAKEIIKRIKQISRITTSENQTMFIEDLMRDYEKLSNIAKSYVDNYNKLSYIGEQREMMFEAEVLFGMIENLSLLNQPSKNDTEPVRIAYNNMSNEARLYVDNYFDLVIIEASLGIYESQRGRP